MFGGAFSLSRNELVHISHRIPSCCVNRHLKVPIGSEHLLFFFSLYHIDTTRVSGSLKDTESFITATNFSNGVHDLLTMFSVLLVNFLQGSVTHRRRMTVTSRYMLF